jgi:hypothetical protein
VSATKTVECWEGYQLQDARRYTNTQNPNTHANAATNHTTTCSDAATPTSTNVLGVFNGFHNLMFSNMHTHGLKARRTRAPLNLLRVLRVCVCWFVNTSAGVFTHAPCRCPAALLLSLCCHTWLHRALPPLAGDLCAIPEGVPFDSSFVKCDIFSDNKKVHVGAGIFVVACGCAAWHACKHGLPGIAGGPRRFGYQGPPALRPGMPASCGWSALRATAGDCG